MEPVSPVLGDEFKHREVVFAETQKEYIPLPVHRNPKGLLLSRWRLNDAERAAIAAGADIYLWSFTRNEPLLPCMIEIGDCQRSILEKAEVLGLIPSGVQG